MNLPSILVLSAIVLIVGLIIFFQIRNKKNGKSSCSCGCGGCAMKDVCHQNKKS